MHYGLVRAVDVEGPVLAEVFVVLADDGEIRITGPCGPAPWHLEVPAGEDPMVVTRSIVSRVLGPPVLLHSTSWRRAKGAVVLTFVVVVEEASVSELPSLPVQRAELARGGATTAAEEIASRQVLEHALRHLAWLMTDDPIVSSTLSGTWKRHLSGYLPEPFTAFA
jgi:hypothetical protein